MARTTAPAETGPESRVETLAGGLRLLSLFTEQKPAPDRPAQRIVRGLEPVVPATRDEISQFVAGS